MRLGTGIVSSTLTRGYGTLAGLGIIGAAIFAVPSTLLLDPVPPPEAYLATVAGLVTGLVCMVLSWERIDPRWLHLVAVLATVEAAWAVAVFGQAYTAFFFLIAVAVAYVTPDPKSLLPHLALIGFALIGPVLYGPEDPQSTLQMALVVYPLLVLTAGIFAYLRQRMVSDRQSYRLFAEETLSLANRIAGSPISAPQPRRHAEDEDPPAWSRLRVSTRASAAAACVLSLPLIGSGLAVAGVKLPSFAAESFESVGIELPNQDAESEGAASDRNRDQRGAGSQGQAGAESDGASGSSEAPGDEAAPGSSSHGGSKRPGGPPASDDLLSGDPRDLDQRPSNELGGNRPGGDGNHPGGGRPDSVKDILDNARTDVDDLLDELKLEEPKDGRVRVPAITAGARMPPLPARTARA